MYKPLEYIPQMSQKYPIPAKKVKLWSWSRFAQRFVPATIWLWSLIMVSGVVLGYFNGKII